MMMLSSLIFVPVRLRLAFASVASSCDVELSSLFLELRGVKCRLDTELDGFMRLTRSLLFCELYCALKVTVRSFSSPLAYFSTTESKRFCSTKDGDRGKSPSFTFFIFFFKSGEAY